MCLSRFFRIVSVQGTPFEMGTDYGRETADLIRELIAHSKQVYDCLQYSPETIRRIRERHEDTFSAQAPELIEEIRGMSNGAGVSYEQLMDACLQREIRKAMSIDQDYCTTCLISGRATLTGTSIIGHNWDSRLSQEKAVVTVARPRSGSRFVTIGPVGRPGCEGINERGLTLFMTGVKQKRRIEIERGQDPLAIPSSWTHHILLAYSNCEDAIGYCKRIRGAAHGMTWAVGDSRGFSTVEISCGQVNTTMYDAESSDPKDWIESTANHYVSPTLSELGPSPRESPGSYMRRERMISLLRANIGKMNVNMVQGFLRDHYGQFPICRHNDEQSYTTISSEIGQPKEKRLWIAFGPPCRNRYETFSL